tara:strand:- start:547 stop:1491 length:945 start_codon:yes stop_codon:yes gene_type:complete
MSSDYNMKGVLKQKYLKKAKRTKRTCAIEGCNKKAIGSHVVPKTLLNAISSGNVYSIETDWINNVVRFERFGVNKDCKINILCHDHDMEKFNRIDSRDIDVTDEVSILQLMYRVILAEQARWNILAEAAMKELKLCSSDERLNILGFLQYKDRNDYRLKISRKYVESDLHSMSCTKIGYKSRVIERIPIAGASYFSDTSGGWFIINLGNLGFKFYPQVSISIFPIGDSETGVVISYILDEEQLLSEKYKDFNSMSDLDFKKFINDIILSRVTYWFASSEFYEKKIKYRNDEISRIISSNVTNKNPTVELNILDD